MWGFNLFQRCPCFISFTFSCARVYCVQVSLVPYKICLIILSYIYRLCRTLHEHTCPCRTRNIIHIYLAYECQSSSEVMLLIDNQFPLMYKYHHNEKHLFLTICSLFPLWRHWIFVLFRLSRKHVDYLSYRQREQLRPFPLLPLPKLAVTAYRSNVSRVIEF